MVTATGADRPGADAGRPRTDRPRTDKADTDRADRADPDRPAPKGLLFWTVAGPVAMLVVVVGGVAAIAGVVLRRLVSR